MVLRWTRLIQAASVPIRSSASYSRSRSYCLLKQRFYPKSASAMLYPNSNASRSNSKMAARYLCRAMSSCWWQAEERRRSNGESGSVPRSPICTFSFTLKITCISFCQSTSLQRHPKLFQDFQIVWRAFQRKHHSRRPITLLILCWLPRPRFATKAAEQSPW